MFIENEAFYVICFTTIKLNTSTYEELEHLIIAPISGIIAQQEFPGR